MAKSFLKTASLSDLKVASLLLINPVLFTNIFATLKIPAGLTPHHCFFGYCVPSKAKDSVISNTNSFYGTTVNDKYVFWQTPYVHV